jgi:hypothetical protein
LEGVLGYYELRWNCSGSRVLNNIKRSKQVPQRREIEYKDWIFCLDRKCENFGLERQTKTMKQR